MRLTLCAVGRLRSGPEAALVDDYADRIRSAGRSLGISRFAIKEIDAPRGLDGEKRKALESTALLKAAPAEARRIVLDERGEQVKSRAFANALGRLRDDGAQDVAFFIGGADGHGAAILDGAHMKIAFGTATWPHMLVRTMLCEQIYRAMMILSGHPYHRD